jgi:hypothetical protein
MRYALPLIVIGLCAVYALGQPHYSAATAIRDAVFILASWLTGRGIDVAAWAFLNPGKRQRWS